MKNENNLLNSDIFISIFLSLLFFISAWIYPLINIKLNFNTYFVFFFQDIQYFSIIKNFFSFDFSEVPNFSSDNSIILPITSLVLHSLFYEIFSTYSFPILEILLNFVFFLLLVKIFKFTFKKNYLFNLLLFLILYQILYLIFLVDLFEGYFNSLYLILESFIGNRFPRPLITKILIVSYLLIAVYFLNNKNNKNILIYFALIFLLTIFQYPYLFFYQITGLILLYFLNYKTHRFQLNQKVVFALILLVGIVTFFYMTSFVENDYFIRVGQYNVDEKNIIIFYKNIFQKIFYYKNVIFIFAFIVTYLFLRRTKKANISLLKIIFILTISGFIVIISYPLLFNQKILSYHKFFDLFYLFISLYLIFGVLVLFRFILNHNYFLIKKKNNFLFFGLILLIFCNSLIFFKTQKQDIINSEKIVDFNNLDKFLYSKKNDPMFIESCVYTNSEFLYTIWKIYHNYACTSDGFVNSLTNNEIFTIFYERSKKISLNDDDIKKTLTKINYSDNKNKFLEFLFLYTYKIKYYEKDINNNEHYLSYFSYMDNSEFLRLRSNIKKTNKDFNQVSQITILNKKIWDFINIEKISGEKLFENDTFVIFYTN